jgi:hypothetical protein
MSLNNDPFDKLSAILRQVDMLEREINRLYAAGDLVGADRLRAEVRDLRAHAELQQQTLQEQDFEHSAYSRSPTAPGTVGDGADRLRAEVRDLRAHAELEQQTLQEQALEHAVSSRRPTAVGEIVHHENEIVDSILRQIATKEEEIARLGSDPRTVDLQREVEVLKSQVQSEYLATWLTTQDLSTLGVKAVRKHLYERFGVLVDKDELRKVLTSLLADSVGAVEAASAKAPQAVQSALESRGLKRSAASVAAPPTKSSAAPARYVALRAFLQRLTLDELRAFARHHGKAVWKNKGPLIDSLVSLGVSLEAFLLGAPMELVYAAALCLANSLARLGFSKLSTMSHAELVAALIQLAASDGHGNDDNDVDDCGDNDKNGEDDNDDEGAGEVVVDDDDDDDTCDSVPLSDLTRKRSRTESAAVAVAVDDVERKAKPAQPVSASSNLATATPVTSSPTMLQDFLRPARGARAFRMADEQRQYRWTVALAEQLFNDYAALTPRVDDASTPPFHYLNAFHVAVDETAEAATSVTVFDGQQRLTTTVLIVLAVWQSLLPFKERTAAKTTCRAVLDRLTRLFDTAGDDDDEVLLDLRGSSNLHAAEHHTLLAIVQALRRGRHDVVPEDLTNVGCVFRHVRNLLADKYRINVLKGLTDVDRLAVFAERILARVHLVEIRVNSADKPRMDQIFTIVNRPGLLLDALELLRGELLSRLDRDASAAKTAADRVNLGHARSAVTSMLEQMHTLAPHARTMFVPALARLLHYCHANDERVQHVAGDPLRVLLCFYSSSKCSTTRSFCESLLVASRYFGSLFDTSQPFGFVSHLVTALDSSIDQSVSVFALALASVFIVNNHELPGMFPRLKQCVGAHPFATRWRDIELFMMAMIGSQPTQANACLVDLLKALASDNRAKVTELVVDRAGDLGKRLFRFLLRNKEGDTPLFSFAKSEKRSVLIYLLLRVEADSSDFRFNIHKLHDIDHIVPQSTAASSDAAVKATARDRARRLLVRVNELWVHASPADVNAELDAFYQVHAHSWHNSLGNLTPLESSLNRRAGNSSALQKLSDASRVRVFSPFLTAEWLNEYYKPHAK